MNVDVEKSNIYCYLDIKVEEEKCGRVVIELHKNLLPKTVENFRSLCTGEKGLGIQGKYLHYKESIIHRVVPEFIIQGGDIMNSDGTGGESIYGLEFDDENFLIKHDTEGIVGMCSNDKKTNSSQFYITTVPCPHLDGRNVAFGKVVKGLKVIKDLSNVPRNNDVPLKKCVIVNCGEFKEGESWNYWETDGTEDVYPPWPDDWEYEHNNINIEKVVTNIKNSGNFYYKKDQLIDSERKYKKALRYINWYVDKKKEFNDKMRSIKINSLLNMSTVKLKRQKYQDVVSLCSEVLDYDTKLVKAYYQRGQAYMGLKEYDKALINFKNALEIMPNNKEVYSEFQRARMTKLRYMKKEKELFSKMFNK